MNKRKRVCICDNIIRTDLALECISCNINLCIPCSIKHDPILCKYCNDNPKISCYRCTIISNDHIQCEDCDKNYCTSCIDIHTTCTKYKICIYCNIPSLNTTLCKNCTPHETCICYERNCINQVTRRCRGCKLKFCNISLCLELHMLTCNRLNYYCKVCNTWIRHNMAFTHCNYDKCRKLICKCIVDTKGNSIGSRTHICYKQSSNV